MAKRNASSQKVTWKGFINVHLTKSDKAVIRDNPLSDARIIDFITKRAQDGYKVSLSYSERGGFYTVTVYGNETTNINAGYALSIRHSDFGVAYTALNYVLDQCGDAESWEDHFGTAGNNLDW